MQTNIQNSNIYRDHESEEQVIQALYLNPELIYQIEIRTDDFTHYLYRGIYEAMLTLYGDGIAFDLKTIKDVKPELTLIDLVKVLSGAITSANINYHSKKIRQATFNRKCLQVLESLEVKLGNDEFMPEAEKYITNLYEVQQRQRHGGIKEITATIQEQIKEAKTKDQYGIPTSFRKLNHAIVGMCPRHFWIIGGYTSHGKSTLLSQMIDDTCSRGHRMIVFSVEDSKEDKIIRLTATKTQIPLVSIVKGLGDDSKINYALSAIEKYNLYVYDDVYTLGEMDMKIKKHKIQGGVDVVAIDFVQNILTGGESIYDRMSEVAINLQKMAKKHNICMIGLSQISKDKEKGSISLRGAQELASAADIVLWIDREPDKPELSLIVRKNRPFGVTGKFPCRFSETWTNIREVY